MESRTLITLILSGVAALFAFYFRESFKNAKIKKLIAIRLESYLNNWFYENVKYGLLNFIEIGKQWYADSLKALEQNGFEGVRKVDIKYWKKLDDLKKSISHPDSELHNSFYKEYEKIKNMNERVFEFHIKQLEDCYSYILNNINFISDEEAAKISFTTICEVIKIRNHITEIIYNTKTFLTILRYTDSFNIDEIVDPLCSIVEHLVIYPKLADPLLDRIQKIRKKSLILLTLEEMILNT